MALSRVKTWNVLEQLMAADLNAEFDNIINNATSLFSPLTANLDCAGYQLTSMRAGNRTGSDHSPGYAGRIWFRTDLGRFKYEDGTTVREILDGVILPAYALASLSAATAGRLVRVTDDTRGVWMDTGTLWVPTGGGVLYAKDFDVDAANADNATALNAFFTAARALSRGLTLELPAGVLTVLSSVDAGGFGNVPIVLRGHGYRQGAGGNNGTSVVGQMNGGAVLDFTGNEHSMITQLSVSADTSVAYRPDVGILLGGALLDAAGTSVRGGANVLRDVSASGQFTKAAIYNHVGDLVVFNHVIAGTESNSPATVGTGVSTAVSIVSQLNMLSNNSEAVAATRDTTAYNLTYAGWVKTSMTAAQTITGPDGLANSASRLTATGANATAAYDTAVQGDATQLLYAAKSVAREFIVYLRRATGTGAVGIDAGAGSIDQAANINSSTWTRVRTSATVANPVVRFVIATSGDAVDVWGAFYQRPSYAITSDYHRLSSATGITNFTSLNSYYSVVNTSNVVRAAILIRGISGLVSFNGDSWVYGGTAAPGIEFIESGQQINTYNIRHEAGTTNSSFLKTDGFKNSYLSGNVQSQSAVYPLIDADANYHGLQTAGADGYITNSVIRLAPAGTGSFLLNNTTSRTGLYNNLIWLLDNTNLTVSGGPTSGNIIYNYDGTATVTLNASAGNDGNLEFQLLNGFRTWGANGAGAWTKQLLSATAALNFGNTVSGAASDLTITVTGAASGDAVALGIPNGAIVAGAAGYYAWVSAANTVTVRFWNASGGDLNPAEATFRTDVYKR